MTPDRQADLASGLARVRSHAAAAAARCGRDPGAITVVAVGKTWPAADLAAVRALGVEDLGEAREQELRAKAGDPTLAGVRWHFLGRLQTNKARRVAVRSDVVHSLDRLELVAPLARGAGERPAGLSVFVQVSADGDPARGGVAPAAAVELAEAAQQAGLAVAGLMVVAPTGAMPRPVFAALRELGQQLVTELPEASGLSMGMSGDLEEAVAEGATHLRVGGAIFGSRPPAGR